MKSLEFKKVIPYLIFILIGFIFFPSAGRDDVYITYWPAFTLSTFGEIVNYNGERIEQSSSLLHTLVLALLHYTTKFNLADIGKFVSVFFGLVTVFLAGKLSYSLNRNLFLTQVYAATSVPLVYWSFGSLESSLVAASVLYMIISVINYANNQLIINLISVKISFLIYILLRPEAIFVITFFLFISISVLVINKKKYSHFTLLIAVALLLFLLLMVFRIFYFGSIFPHPVIAKVGGSLYNKIYFGKEYYFNSLKENLFFAVLIIPIVYFIFLRFKRTTKDINLVVTISFILSQAAFILLTGGDWMEEARFFVPIIAPATVLLVKFLDLKSKNRIILFALLFFKILIIFTSSMKFSTSSTINNYNRILSAYQGAKDFSTFEILNRVHYRDIPTIIELKKLVNKINSLSIKPTIMSGQGGMVPFHTFLDFYGKAMFLDIRSLSTNEFLDCKITKSIPKHRGGLLMSYEYFFINADDLLSECDIDLPEIIYDLSTDYHFGQILKNSNNYTLVYSQEGDLLNHGFLKGRKIIGSQFIAVRSDLVSKLDIKHKKHNI